MEDVHKAVCKSVCANFVPNKDSVSVFSLNSAKFSAITEFRVYQERFQFTFFYLSSSNEKERSSSSLATHVESVWALHNPQHKNKSI